MSSLARAIAHAVNYNNLDSKLDTPDWKIGELLAPEVAKHLAGQTDVQVIDAMTPEQREQIGRA